MGVGGGELGPGREGAAHSVCSCSDRTGMFPLPKMLVRSARMPGSRFQFAWKEGAVVEHD